MSSNEPVLGCRECGAPNEVALDALAQGRFRCYQCGAITEIASPSTLPVHAEPVQTDVSDVPSIHNTAQVAASVEAREGWLTCSVALFMVALASVLVGAALSLM